MPNRKLDPVIVDQALTAKGINQAKVAEALSVSRESVSKWLLGKTSPRPGKLLDLALLLDRDIDDISTIDRDPYEPVIAFRKKGAAKITDEYIENAKHMGRLLAPLTKYLPFDQLVAPRHLKNPTCEFSYLEEAAQVVRRKLCISDSDAIDFPELVGLFSDLQAVLVPVLWGMKKNHKNAVHIYLPESTTTWVYLNLDTYVFDFLFWMAHELGHVLSPSLRGEAAEDFADAFAGALLFPANLCADLSQELDRKRTDSSRLSAVAGWAEQFGISPITVSIRVNSYRVTIDKPDFNFGNALFAIASKLNQNYYTVSESILKSERASAKEYISKCSEAFKTPFFDALRNYAIETNPDDTFYQSILDIPISDAKALRAELC